MKNYKWFLFFSMVLCVLAAMSSVQAEEGVPPQTPAVNLEVNDNLEGTSVDSKEMITLGSDAMRSKTITVDFKDTDISNVLRILSKQFNLNIIAGEDVVGKVTVHFKDVTLEGALSAILGVNGYDYTLEGNVIRVSKRTTLAAEQEAKDALRKYEDVVTEVFVLKFLDATDVKNLLFPETGGQTVLTTTTGTTIQTAPSSNISLLSPRGKVKVLLRKGFKGFKFGAFTPTTTTTTVGAAASTSGVTGAGTAQFIGPSVEKSGQGGEKSNIIVVQDIPSVIEKVRKIISIIDTKPRQVLIDAKIFEINKNDMKDLGLEYSSGSSGLTSAAYPPVVPIELVKQGTKLNTQGGGTGRFFDVAGGTDAFGNNGLQLQLQKITGNQFDVVLRALQKDADVNELSSPRVVVLENQEASIIVGEAYPIFQTTIATGATPIPTESLSFYQPIGIILQVIPMVNADGNINMVIHPSVSSIASFVTGSTGITAPRLNIRETDTQVLIKDKETLVIGGLLQDRVKESIWGIPVLCKIPILGHLFSRKKTEDIKVELVIFITPKIVRDYEFDEREKVIDGDVQERKKVLDRHWIEELKRQFNEAVK